VHGQRGGPFERGLGLPETAANPFPLAEHEKRVPPDPAVLLQTVSTFRYVLNAVVRRRSRFHGFRQGVASVRLDRFHGHDGGALVVPLRVVQVRVDAARRPFAPAGHAAVTARGAVQFGQDGRISGTDGRTVVGQRRRRRRRRRAVSGIELRVSSVVSDVLVRGDALRGYVYVERAQVQQQHHRDQRERALRRGHGDEHAPVHRETADAEQLVRLNGPIGEYRSEVLFNAQRIRVAEHQFDARHQHDDQASEHGRHDAHDERHVVPGPDTVVQPLAVVVEFLHAFIARAAVFGPVSGRVNVAQVTFAVLDDVRVLALVQLRHGVAPVVAYRPELRVRGVYKQRGDVRHDVQEEQTAQHEQHDRIEVGPEAGQQDAERTGAERGQHQPTGHLLRMPRHLQPIGPPMFPPRGLVATQRHAIRASHGPGGGTRLPSSLSPQRSYAMTNSGGEPITGRVTRRHDRRFARAKKKKKNRARSPRTLFHRLFHDTARRLS